MGLEDEIMATARDRARAAIRAAFDTVKTTFSTSVRPLYVVGNGERPTFIGSCVLVAAADQNLLVTAAHVLDHARISTLYIAGDATLIPLRGASIVTTPPAGNRLADKIDFSVLFLPGEIVSQLMSAHWIRPDQIDSNDVVSTTRTYIARGYPASKNKKIVVGTKNIKYVPHTFLGRSIPPGEYPPLGISEDTHVAVSFDKRKIADELGVRTNPIDPHGMSGGGLFVVDVETALRTGDADSLIAKLVGIVIEMPRNKNVVVATRFGPIQSAIVASRPELCTAFTALTRILCPINIQSGSEPDRLKS